MSLDDAFKVARTILKVVGFVIAVVAVAKLCGVPLPMKVGIIELAAVAIACAHA